MQGSMHGAIAMSSDDDSSSVGEESSICYDSDDAEFDVEEMEVGSVACIYTQLVCVTAFVIWLTASNSPA